MEERIKLWLNLITLGQGWSTLAIIFLSRVYGDDKGLLIKGMIDILTGLWSVGYQGYAQMYTNTLLGRLLIFTNATLLSSGLYFVVQGSRGRHEESLFIFLSGVIMLSMLAGIRYVQDHGDYLSIK